MNRGAGSAAADANSQAPGNELTLTGQVLGSPNYLSPEQAEARHDQVGPASDVYSLGAVLYWLLTARAPFQAATVADTILQVRTADPVSPRLLNPGVPKDLETICLKCLEKDIARRYSTAQELADELSRYLRDEPIRARALSPLGKGIRWSRRNPSLAAALAALILVFFFGFGGVTWEWRRAQAERLRAERNEALARQSERRLAENLYAADISLAQKSLSDHNLGRARQLLEQHRPRSGQSDLRGWEWYYLWQEAHSDAETEFELPPGSKGLAICPRGRWLGVSSGTNRIELWDLPLRKPVRCLRESLSGMGHLHTALAFAPAGDLLAATTEAGHIGIWRLDPFEEAGRLVFTNYVGALLFSPHGRYLAVREVTQTPIDYVSVWTVDQPRQLWRLKVPHGDQLNRGMAFRPDNGRLAAGTQDGFLVLVDSESNEAPKYIQTPANAITALAYSPDGRLLASAAGYEGDPIRLWDAQSGEARGELAGHKGWIGGLRFSPDGSLLYSAASDQTLRIWDVAKLRQRSLYRGHQDAIYALTAVTNNQHLWTAGNDGKIIRWDLTQNPQTKSQQILEEFGTQAVFSRDSRYIGAVVDHKMEHRVLIREAKTLAAIPHLAPPFTNTVSILGFGSNQLTLLFRDKPVQVWSLQEQRVVKELPDFTYQRGPMSVDSAGRRLLQFDLNAFSIYTWELDTGRTNGPIKVVRPEGKINFVGPLSVAPDLQTLVIFELNGTMHWWRLNDGRHVDAVRAYEAGTFSAMTFSPDSRWVATAGHNGVWKLWDVATHALIHSERGFLNGILGLAFSPDSRRLATTSSGAESVKLWDMATGRELVRLNVWRDLITDVGFSPDGSVLYVRNRPGSIAVWRTPPPSLRSD